MRARGSRTWTRKHELDSCTQQLQEQMKAEEQAKQDKHR